MASDDRTPTKSNSPRGSSRRSSRSSSRSSYDEDVYDGTYDPDEEGDGCREDSSKGSSRSRRKRSRSRTPSAGSDSRTPSRAPSCNTTPRVDVAGGTRSGVDKSIAPGPAVADADDAEAEAASHHSSTTGKPDAPLGLDANSLELAVMVMPDMGMPAGPGDIWSRVVESGGELPGSWDTSTHGALQAARRGDEAVAAYLAARCFREGGGDESGAAVLAKPDDSTQKFLWLSTVEPLVVDVPKGRERLCTKFEDSDCLEFVPTDKILTSKLIAMLRDDCIRVKGRPVGKLVGGLLHCAEHFRVGETVELSRLTTKHKLRRLVLSQEELLELRDFLPDASMKAKIGTPSFYNREVGTTYVPGGPFHVLVYPLAGDLTKALVRPARTQMPDKQVLYALGETLVSQCAKSGHWSLVETLLQAGVPYPDLGVEFANVCGHHAINRKQWMREVGNSLGGRSLLELAVRAPGDSPLRVVLEALRASRRPVELGDRVVVSIATAQRWDLLKLVLEDVQDTGNSVCMTSAAPLAKLPQLAAAPPEVIELVQSQVYQEKVSGPRARSLREYFERQLSGELMCDTTAPCGFKLVDKELQSPGGLRALGQGVRLGGACLGDGTELVFASITPDELSSALDALSDDMLTMLPVDLSGKTLSLKDPTDSGVWLAVACPVSYLKKVGANGTDLVLRVPGSRLPAPYIPRPTVRIRVSTPCCCRPLEGILIHVNGMRAGNTEDNGELRLSLPPGKHSITAPGQSKIERVVEVRKGCADEVSVEMYSNGDLFFYLQDMSLDDESRDGVMLCSNKYQVPSDARNYIGAVSMQRRTVTSVRRSTLHFTEIKPLLSLGPDTKCTEALSTLSVAPGLGPGWKWDPNEEAVDWVEEQQRLDECVLALLSSIPLRLGTLIGNKSTVGSPAPTSQAASTTSLLMPGSPGRRKRSSPGSASSQRSHSRPASAGGVPRGNPAVPPPRRARSSARSATTSGRPPLATPYAAGGAGGASKRPGSASGKGGGFGGACGTGYAGSRSFSRLVGRRVFDPHDVDFVYVT